MKKKLLTVALAATMVVGSVFSAFAEDIYSKNWKNETNDAYQEVDNPLKGKSLDKVVVTYKAAIGADAAANGWDGIFSFFDEASGGRVSFQTRPYLCYNDGATPASFLDVNQPNDKGNGESKVEKGKENTVVWTITKTDITCTVDGAAINLGTNGGEATPADVLNALLTYPKLTLGVGLAKSAYWNTELSEVTLTISDGAGDPAPAPTPAPTDDKKPVDDKKPAPVTGDSTTSMITLLAVAAVGASLVVFVSKKSKVTE